jgi:hypothetical protein
MPDRGQVKGNEAALTAELVGTFRRYYDVVRREGDQRRSYCAAMGGRPTAPTPTALDT